MAIPAVRRALEWHEKEAEKLHAQIEVLRKKGFGHRLEDPKRGQKHISGMHPEVFLLLFSE